MRKFGKKILTIALCVCMALLPSMTAFAQTVSDANIPMAEYILEPYDEAVSALEDIVNDRDVDALVYLSDAYSIRSEADPYSMEVAIVSSGQQVSIIGVGEDSGQNIWYKISCSYGEDSFTGYIQRENLAFADERLIDWEAQYVQKKAKLRMFFALRRATTYEDIETFPDSYKEALYKIKNAHPEWLFVKMDTGLDWNAFLAAESKGNVNLVPSSSNSAWKNGDYGGGWSYCSQAIIKYYIDPRNFFTEDRIFQFEHLVYNENYHSVESVQKILDGTFMSGKITGTSTSYAQAFFDIGKSNSISPTLLASRVKQEQGVAGTSPLISGTYSGYEGYYNYYNIGASGKTQEEVIKNGLKKAKESGWNTRMKSLESGGSFLGKNYIFKGQNTLYLQKFNVTTYSTFSHQYMQNLRAASQEGVSTYNAYKKIGLIDSGKFVFRIPVLNNMPSYPASLPENNDVISLSTETISNLPVDEEAVITTFINGAQNSSADIAFSSSDTSVATVSDTGVVKAILPGTTTITCKKKVNPQEANVITCKVTVIKADIKLDHDDYPDIEVTYDSDKTLKDIELPDGYRWVNDSITPIVDNDGYSVIYNPDNSKYNNITITLPITVKKAKLTESDITLPDDLEGEIGHPLSEIILPAGFYWEDETETLPQKAGTYTFDVDYCRNSDNYEVTTGLTVTVEGVCKNHEYGELTGTPADCTHDGELTCTCKYCDETKTVTQTALEHNYVGVVTTEATYYKDGVRTYTCSRCGDSYTEVIPATGGPHTHSYTSDITKEATCFEQGEKTYTCACGDSYTETILALGHDLVDGACTRCDYKVPQEPVHVHNYSMLETEATCTTDGLKTYVCACGTSYTETIPALGHNYVDSVCTRCDEKEKIDSEPTVTPTATPTTKPTATPTAKPTVTPTAKPTATPTAKPTATPTVKPTATPTTVPSTAPTVSPSVAPTATPTAKPTTKPTVVPQITSIVTPMAKPTATPTAKPTTKPTVVPEITSIATPTAKPTSKPTVVPEITSIATPTAKPTAKPTVVPEITSIATPTAKPTAKPTVVPEITSIATPTAKPTAKPTTKPTVVPQITSIATPTAKPTAKPTVVPEITSIATPTAKPTAKPTVVPEITKLVTPKAEATSAPKPTTAPTTAPKATVAVPQITTLPTQAPEQTTVKPTDTAKKNTDTTQMATTTPNVTPEETKSLNAVLINMNDSTVLTADRIGKLSDSDEKLELLMPNDVKWSIDLESIENIEDLNIDMGVTLGEADIPKKVLEDALQNAMETANADEEYVLMSLAYDGPFTFDATISIPIEEGHEGKVANLYYYNPLTKELEFIGAANVEADGTAKFNMKHASDYVILFADASLEEIASESDETQATKIAEPVSVQTVKDDSTLNIILIAAVIVLLIVIMVVCTIFIKLHHNIEDVDSDDEDEYEEED